MTLAAVLQIALFGLVWRGLYALAASGLTLMVGVMKIMNIAHGEMMMIGAYVASGLSRCSAFRRSSASPWPSRCSSCSAWRFIRSWCNGHGYQPHRDAA